jgi:hypothetical protein
MKNDWRRVFPFDMNSPNPDSGEEWFHTNTQLFKSTVTIGARSVGAFHGFVTPSRRKGRLRPWTGLSPTH